MKKSSSRIIPYTFVSDRRGGAAGVNGIVDYQIVLFEWSAGQVLA